MYKVDEQASEAVDRLVKSLIRERHLRQGELVAQLQGGVSQFSAKQIVEELNKIEVEQNLLRRISQQL